jgi:hypothetical protein
MLRAGRSRSASGHVVARTPAGTRACLAGLYVVAIFVITYNVLDRSVPGGWDIIQQGLVGGAAVGVVTALNDVNVVATADWLVVRNPLLVRYIPWIGIEEAIVNQGLDLQLVGARYPVTVTAATGTIRFARSRPTALKQQIDAHIENARARATGFVADEHTTLKYSWLVFVPAAAGALSLYAWVALAVFR